MWSTTLANLKESLNKIALDVHEDDDDDGDDYEKLSEISNSRNSSFSDRRISLNHGHGFSPIANGHASTSNSEEVYMVDMVYYTDEITKVLNNQYQGPEKPLLFLLHGLNTDSKNYSKPAAFEGIEKFETDLKTLHPILTECRVLKSKLELSVIQYANDISSEAHIEVMRKVKPEMKEYQLESIFLHHTYFYGSCRHCSYTCICATGDNSSVLHYGHAAAPNDRTLRDEDMALLDMGAEFHFYSSDITCSFPVNGKFTSYQRLIYNAVLDAHDDVISTMKPGVNWVDMPKLAEKTILQSLKKGSLLVGDVDEMMVERLGSVFMPHGLGHLMGLDTHDPGGYLNGAERPKEPGLKSLRTSRDLMEGMVITVEPGCYFIDALLVPAMDSPKTSKFFNREAITKFRGFGGVRIESDLGGTDAPPVTCIAFSISGRLLFAVYSNGDCFVWDTLLAKGVKAAGLSKVKNPQVREFIEKSLLPDSDRLPAAELLKYPFLNLENVRECLSQAVNIKSTNLSKVN